MNTHPFSLWSFLSGIVLIAAGAGFVTHRHDLVTSEQLAVIVPVTLIVLGVSGIAATLHRSG